MIKEIWTGAISDDG